MNKTIINIKTDKETKENAKKLAGELGLPLSTLMNAYLKDIVRSREVYFSAIPKMNPKLEKTTEQAERDLKKGINISPVLTTPEEMDAYLNSK